MTRGAGSFKELEISLLGRLRHHFVCLCADQPYLHRPAAGICEQRPCNLDSHLQPCCCEQLSPVSTKIPGIAACSVQSTVLQAWPVRFKHLPLSNSGLTYVHCNCIPAQALQVYVLLTLACSCCTHHWQQGPLKRSSDGSPCRDTTPSMEQPLSMERTRAHTRATTTAGPM